MVRLTVEEIKARGACYKIYELQRMAEGLPERMSILDILRSDVDPYDKQWCIQSLSIVPEVVSRRMVAWIGTLPIEEKCLVCGASEGCLAKQNPGLGAKLSKYIELLEEFEREQSEQDQTAQQDTPQQETAP